MTILRTVALAALLLFIGTSVAHAAPKDDGSGAVRLILIGPGLVLILLIVCALIMLITAFLRKADTLTAFGKHVLDRLEERRVLTPLRGVTAALLCLILSFVLFSQQTFAILGALILTAGIALTGIGLCVAAVHLGQIWGAALGMRGASSLTTLSLGLMILLLAACVPLVGWLAVIIAVGGGLGAVLECLVGRR